MKKIFLLTAFFWALTSNAQTIIGWTQFENFVHEYKVDYCDGVHCYVEFGFDTTYLEMPTEFYFYKKDTAVQHFFVANTVEFADSIDNWNLYYTIGISVDDTSEIPLVKEYSLMLLDSDFESWSNGTSMPMLIQLLEINENDQKLIYSFEPRKNKCKAKSSYTAIKQRAIDLNFECDIMLQYHNYWDLDSNEYINLHFTDRELKIYQNQNKNKVDVWTMNINKKEYHNGQWHYILENEKIDSAFLELRFPKNFNWEDAQLSKLPSLEMYTNIQPHVLSEIILDTLQN